MGRFSVLARDIPYSSQELRGNLIVTRAAALKLDVGCRFGCSSSGWKPRYMPSWKLRMTRSALTGKGLRQAKKGTTLCCVTMAFFMLPI